jgi:NarL family two-component system response regulator LiaR
MIECCFGSASSGIIDESETYARRKARESVSLKTILIADDSASVRSVIREFLKDLPGIEICGEAVNGLDAIEKAKKLRPSLVLLDLSMPRMNGAEVASVLKKTMPKILIVLFTMQTNKIGRALASAIGVDAVLSKPDGVRQIVETVNAVLATAQ